MELTAAEARVLGCLIEGQVAAPDEYSMTLDELRFACNQTRGRDPVVAFDDRAVEDALLSLKSKGLARFVVAGRTRGPVEYRHRADERWRLSQPELAVLAVLLLRGPQTVGEVRGALGREPMEPPIDVEAVLDALAGRTPTPFAVRLGVASTPGEQRWAEALTGQATTWQPEPPEPAGRGGAGVTGKGGPDRPGSRADQLSWTATDSTAARPSPTLAEVVDRLANIERRLASIETALDALRASTGRGTPPAGSSPPGGGARQGPRQPPQEPSRQPPSEAPSRAHR